MKDSRHYRLPVELGGGTYAGTLNITSTIAALTVPGVGEIRVPSTCVAEVLSAEPPNGTVFSTGAGLTLSRCDGDDAEGIWYYSGDRTQRRWADVAKFVAQPGWRRYVPADDGQPAEVDRCAVRSGDGVLCGYPANHDAVGDNKGGVWDHGRFVLNVWWNEERPEGKQGETCGFCNEPITFVLLEGWRHDNDNKGHAADPVKPVWWADPVQAIAEYAERIHTTRGGFDSTP